MLGRLVFLPPILFAAALGLACGGDVPTDPSPIPSPVAPAPPPPAPSPVPDLSPLVGVWNLTVRVTEVKGSGCVAETMRSQIGVPKTYALSVVQHDYNVRVTLKSASGDYECSFTPVADRSGFTTYGQGGFYTCEQTFVPYRCTDGTLHSIFTYGEDVSGHLSGTELTGAWDALWLDGIGDSSGVDVKAEFTGNR